MNGPVVPGQDRPDATVATFKSRPPSGERAWLLALLPGFPLLLLVLRVWSLGQQDVQTMLLLLQYANPLGLVSSLMFRLVWALPAGILVLRVLYLLFILSDPEGATRSWVVRLGARTPPWVEVPAAALAVLSWQMRFLPALVALGVVLVALQYQVRRDPDPLWAAGLRVLLPLAVGGLTLAWVLPGARQAWGEGDTLTAVLLVTPALLSVGLTGPLPARAARVLLPLLATTVLVVAPVLVSGGYLTAPVLPRVALEVRAEDEEPRVLIGELVAVDDRFTTLLDREGRVHFVPGAHVGTQVLCTTGVVPPRGGATVHGWHVELSALAWAAPRRLAASQHPLCRGQLPEPGAGTDHAPRSAAGTTAMPSGRL